MSDDETVWVRDTESERRLERYHTDADCHQLAQAAATREATVGDLDERVEECAFCAGDWDPRHGTARELVEMDPEEYDRAKGNGDLITDGGQVSTDTSELIEECHYCGESGNVEEELTFKSPGERFAHPECVADHCYESREKVATDEGVFRIKSVTIRKTVGTKEELLDSYWQAECPVCYRTHETDEHSEEVRLDLIEQVCECCGADWLPPSDWVEDCEICGTSHRESHDCMPLSAREPFPDPEEHRYECSKCGWSGAGDEFGNPEGYCPECDTAAVRAIPVATDGGRVTDGMRERVREYIMALDNETYLRARDVAADMDGLTRNQVGCALADLRRESGRPVVEKWAPSTTPTTWRVERKVVADGGDYHSGAGDGQCLAIKGSDGERCTNGVYGTNEFCGTHKRASDVTTAIEVAESGTKWIRCDECGWQRAEWDGPDPPCCTHCHVRVSRRDYEIRESGDGNSLRADGGQCRECGRALPVGYLCNDCDEVVKHE